MEIFRLMDLPAELRERVYSFVVVKDKPIDIIEPTLEEPHDTFQYDLSADLKHPTLALVSPQMHNEVLSVFYSQNTFRVIAPYTDFIWSHEPERLTARWIRGLSHASKKELQKVLICTTFSSEACCKHWQYSPLYHLAQHRIWGEREYRGFESRSKETKIPLKGWNWVGDVKVPENCEHPQAELAWVHHHALVWTANSKAKSRA